MADAATDFDEAPTAREGAWLWPVALCFGVAGALHLVGMIGQYQAILDPLPRTVVIVVVVALAAAILGLRIPYGRTDRFGKRGAGRGEETPSRSTFSLIPQRPSAEQRGVLWVLLAVACLSAGATGLVLLWATGPLEAAHGWLMSRFLLDKIELLLIDSLAVLPGVGIPWLFLGLAMTGLHALVVSAEGPRGIRLSLLGGLLLGAGAGLGVSRVGFLATSPGRTALVAMLPLFLAAVLAIIRAGRNRPLSERTDAPEIRPPERAAEGGYALLSALIVWGALFGTGLVVWPRASEAGAVLPWSLQPFVGAWFVSWVGVGATAAHVWARKAENPILACGPLLVVCGAVTGIAIAGCSATGAAGRWAAEGGAAWQAAIPVVCLSLAGLCAGGVLSFLKQSVLLQSGTPGTGWSHVGTTVLVGTAIGVAMSACWTVPHVGTLVALAGSGLLALATGGLLVIFDVGGPARHRRWKLAGVFGVLLAMMVGLPWLSRGWLRRDEGIVAMREGTWLTLSVRQEEGRARVVVEPHPVEDADEESHATFPSGPALQRALQSVACLRDRYKRCWLISAGDLRPTEALRRRCEEVRASYYDPDAAVAFRRMRDEPLRSRRGGDSDRPASLALRSTHERFDLIAIAAVSGGHPANRLTWSIEQFERAFERLATRGVLAALVRPTEYGRGQLASLVATFALAAPHRSRAALVGSGSEVVLVLLATKGSPSRWNWAASAQAGMRRVGPIRSFLEVVRGARGNSLRNRDPALLGRRLMGDGGLQFARFVSRRDDWRELQPAAPPVPIWPPSPPSTDPPQTDGTSAERDGTSEEVPFQSR